MRRTRVPLALALVAAFALLVAGCGSSSSTSAKNGGTLTVLSQGDVDSLDPGYAYYQYDYEAYTEPGERALYGWKPGDTSAPVPDLATAMPVVSDGGKTVTIKIKPNIKFSPPVNRAATSADVKYAIERLFLPQVGNGYAQVYFGNIVGAAAYAAGKAKSVTGLETPDPQTLVIKLTTPVGVIANGEALSLPGTAPVPESYAKPFDQGKQSTYAQHLVFTGPYMVPNDAKGNITGYQAGKELTLIRNPNWDPKTDFRPAHLNKIVFLAGNDLTVASRKILSGQSMVNGDYAAPPVSILPLAISQYKSQLSSHPSGGNRYINLNTKVKPFDNINVRKAVASVLNRTDLRLTRGGPYIGTIATHFIPPELSGFEAAGAQAGPGYDFMNQPNGNLALAESYMKKAGYASGKYSGPAVEMVGDNADPAKKTGEAVQAQLQQLGFNLNYQQVPHETMLSKYCEVPKQAVAICPNVGWNKDFFDSQSMIDPVFNGKNIVPTGNTNMSQLNDPTLNKQMDAAEQIVDPAQRAQAWANIDKGVTAQAASIPWLWDNDIGLRSSNVNGAWNDFNSAWDLAFTSLK